MTVTLAPRHFAISLLTALTVLTSARAQDLSFELNERLVIGGDEEGPIESFLAGPRQVRTDSKGNIYVWDGMRADVLVFDARGRYIVTIGKRGEGPGEIRDIVGIHVDNKDRLIVADRISQRFTIYSDLGKGFETKVFAEEQFIHPSPILSLGDSFLLRYSRQASVAENDPNLTGHESLHLFDAGLNWLESFAQMDDLFDLDSPFIQAQSRFSSFLKVATNGTDVVVVAPKIYAGYIYRYTRSDNSWVMEDLKGSPAPGRPYTPVSKADYEAGIKSGATRRAYAAVGVPEGMYHARVAMRSQYIAILNTGQIVNFMMETPPRRKFRRKAELFDQEGRLLGYGPLHFGGHEEFHILWKDVEDRLYLWRLADNGAMVLSVAELEISSR